MVFTISLALFNLGLFGILLISGNQLSKIIRQNFEIQIFMAKDFDPASLNQVSEMLAVKPYLAKNEFGKPEIEYISKEEAGKKFMKETGEDFSQFLGENPLRDAFTIKIAESFLDENQIKSIKADLVKIPGTFEVVYVESLVETIQKNLAKVSAIFLVVAFLSVVTVIWLIRNTIKLSVYAQRFLIRSMVLVGAEPWFIQKPFVFRMLGQGFGGGLLASVFLLICLQASVEFYPPVKTVFVAEQIGIMLIGLMVSGSLLAGISTLFSIRRFVYQRLDELHEY